MTDAPIKEAPTTEDRLQRLFDDARSVLQEFRSAATTLRIAEDGTCPIFFRDCVVHSALPWADVDAFQRKLLSNRAPEDDLILTQLIDLFPSLAGRNLVDVGSFTGTTAFLLRAFMKPDETFLFEPQGVMEDALKAAILRNSKSGGPIHLQRTVLDESNQEIEIGANTPARLSQTRYLRREGGNLRAMAIDDLDLGNIGLINLDFYNDKVPVLRGAIKTLERFRPVVVMDLTARDIAEVRELVTSIGYRELRAGRNSMLYLPT